MNCEFTINGYTKDDIKEKCPAKGEALILLWSFATNHVFDVAEVDGLPAGKRVMKGYLSQMRSHLYNSGVEKDFTVEWAIALGNLFDGTNDEEPSIELICALAQGYAANPGYSTCSDYRLIDSILTVAKGVTYELNNLEAMGADHGLHDSD